MASMRLSFASFFGNNQQDSMILSPPSSQEQTKPYAAMPRLATTTSIRSCSSSLSKEPGLVSWLLSNPPSRYYHHQHHQNSTTAESQYNTATPLVGALPSPPPLPATNMLLSHQSNPQSNFDMDINSTDAGKDKHESKKSCKSRQPLQPHHPLGAMSSDLHLLFPDTKSLDAFFDKIQLLKDDYLQATSTFRSVFHQHLAAARQREAEAIERARRLRAEEESEAQRAFEAEVLSAREQLETLVLEATKGVLGSSASSRMQERQRELDGIIHQGSMGDYIPKEDGSDGTARIASPFEDQHEHKGLVDEAEGLTLKVSDNNKERQQLAGDAKEMQDDIHAKMPPSPLSPQQQQQQQEANQAPTRFGWQSKATNTPFSVSTHEQREEEERRETLKTRLRQLVELEERKMEERFITARSR